MRGSFSNALLAKLFVCVLVLGGLTLKEVNADCGLFAESRSVKEPVFEEPSAPRRNLLAPQARGSFHFNETQVRGESHTLYDLVSDGTQNLAVRHPSIVMGAYQRIWSWMVSEGTDRVYDPGILRKERTRYKALSQHLEANNGRRMVGQLEALEILATYIKNGAGGDRGARAKTLTIVGPAGTGKTELADILTALGKNLTGARADHQMYTFEWVNLGEIRGLGDFLKYLDPERKIPAPISSPYYQSPVALLPREYQQPVLDQARERCREISEFDPDPVLSLDAQSRFIREAIFDHYRREHPGVEMTPEAQLEALIPHVRIKRFVVGMDSFIPVIDAQPRDVNYPALTMKENPLISSTYGPSHPMAWFMTGRYLQSSGTMLLMEEFHRNHKDLIQLTMTLKGSKVLRVDAAPDNPLDTVILAISNYESIQESREAGGLKANESRDVYVHMLRETHPDLVAETVLLMKGMEKLRARPLSMDGREETPVESLDSLFSRANPQDLYELPRRLGDSVLTPRGRYALAYEMQPGKPLVHLSPHALEFIALVTAATRMEIGVEKARELGKAYTVIGKPAFRDPIYRLKILLGEIEVSAQERQELSEILKFVREGENGLDQRDVANVWLTEALSMAQEPQYGNTVTPLLLKEVFRRLINERTEFKPRNNQERMTWINVLDRVVAEIVVPRIQSDVSAAVGQTRGSSTATYDEVFLELQALDLDPSSTRYESSSGQIRPINRARLNKIEEIYVRRYRERLPAQNILRVSPLNRGENGEPRRHRQLLEAIEVLYAEQFFEMTQWSELVQFTRSGNGSSALRNDMGAIMNAMVFGLGHTPYSAKAAFDLVEISKEEQRKKAIEEQQK